MNAITLASKLSAMGFRPHREFSYDSMLLDHKSGVTDGDCWAICVTGKDGSSFPTDDDWQVGTHEGYVGSGMAQHYITEGNIEDAVISSMCKVLEWFQDGNNLPSECAQEQIHRLGCRIRDAEDERGQAVGEAMEQIEWLEAFCKAWDAVQ